MGRNLDDVIKAMSPERQARVEVLAHKKANEMIAAAKSLADFRKAVGKTQDEVGKQLGIKQHAVSQLEKRSDLYVSTLARFVESLGMKLEFVLTAADGTRIQLDNFRPWSDEQQQSPHAGIVISKVAVSKQRMALKEKKSASLQGVVKREAPSSRSKKVTVSSAVNRERRP